MHVNVYFSVLKAETWKKSDKTLSCILLGRRRNPVNTNTAEIFLLLTTLWFPPNALFRTAITCHSLLSYTQNQYHTVVSFLSNNRLWRLHRGFACLWNLSRLTAQSLRALRIPRTGVWLGSWDEISPPPSHFGLPSFLPLPCFPLGWEGEQLWKNLLSQAVSLCQREDWFTLKTASIWPLQRAGSMSTCFIHIPHEGIRKPRTS